MPTSSEKNPVIGQQQDSPRRRDVTENNRKALRSEAAKILSKPLRDFALFCLDRAPDYFWTKPSSSSGKFHPPDELAEGGLVLHTLRVVRVSEILVRSAIPPVAADSIRFAAIFHDVGRYGFGADLAERSLEDHPRLASDWLTEQVAHFANTSQVADDASFSVLLGIAQYAIRTHMGKWGKDEPSSTEGWIVHSADIIAAQYF